MIRIKKLHDIFIISFISLLALISILSYILYYNNSMQSSFWVGIISGIISSSFVAVLILALDYFNEKKIYKHKIVMYLRDISRAIRKGKFDLLENFFYYADTPFIASNEQYKFKKNLQTLIDKSKEHIEEIRKLHSECDAKKLDFESKANEFKALNNILSNLIHEIYIFK